jgi:hypothetical protein
VHAWDAPFQETIEALLEELSPKSLNPALLTQHNLNAGVMVWIGEAVVWNKVRWKCEVSSCILSEHCTALE